MRIWIVLLSVAAVALAQGAAPAGSPAAAPASEPHFTLAEALARARANSPDFQKALVAEGAAQAVHTQAQAALLPSLHYNQNYIFTQDNIFVANDGPHEWISQGDVHEALNFGSDATLRRAQAGQVLARAQSEIAARGLAATVTGGYYALLADQHKVAAAQQALAEAQKYLTISQELEKGGEVAHADVIKAQIQVTQQQQAAREAGLATEQARLALAVLLFPDFNLNFTLQDDLALPPPLPGQPQVAALARQRNPALAAAEASLTQAHQDVTIARAGLLPSAALDYFYGIDAHEFALRNQFGHTNLGNSVMGTLSIPLFDWGASRSNLKVSKLDEQQAKRELSYTQRELLARLAGDYAEAQAARAELASLQQARDLAAESLRLTALRYQDGEGTILELVDAQNTATQATDADEDGMVRYRVALAQLQTLTGAF
ncbi:MAG: TolC family protein [Terriglobales bacterium]